MNEVAKATTFQERVFAEIKSKIGDLMTAEEIKKLVDTAMKEAFFNPVPIYGTGYQSDRIVQYGPPGLVTLVKDLVRDQVKDACNKWIAENPVEWNKIISEIIAKDFLKHVTDYINLAASGPLHDLVNQLRQRGLGI